MSTTGVTAVTVMPATNCDDEDRTVVSTWEHYYRYHSPYWRGGLVRRGDLFGYDYEGEPGDYVCKYPFGDGLSVEACVAMSGQADAWNRRFDRAQIPLMESLVARYFGKPSEAHHG